MTPKIERDFGIRTTNRAGAVAGRNHLVLFTFGILVLLVALLGLAQTAQPSAPSNQWWNSSYQYREKITVAAGSVNVPTQYSVRIQFNHAALVTVTKSLSSGNDIRIVYWNGSTWTELDRRLDDQSSWNSTTTQVWFRTQAAINANQRDDNYYIYYGYSSTGTPPTTWSNIFLFYDDFDDGSLDTGRWTCAWGTCNESSGTLTLGPNVNSKLWATATYSFGVDSRWETRVQLGATYAQYFNYCAAGNTSDYSDDWIDMWTTSSTHDVETGNENSNGWDAYTPTTPTSFHIYTFDREGTSGVRFYQDGVQVGNRTGSTVPDENLRFLLHNDNTTSGQVHDWVRVRKYVSPEPTNFTGGEEVNAEFTYRKRITIDYTKVTCSSGVTEYPALISLSGVTELKTTANGGHVQNTSGYDITFRASDGVTVLDHEVETYDGSAGTLAAWVRVPVLSGTTNTVLYMYYGSSGVSSPTQNPAGVWDSSYVAVQHMHGASYTALDDSTCNHNDVTTEVSDPAYQAAGKIGSSVEFDGNDAVEISDPGTGSTLDITSQVTISAWIRPTAIGQWNRIVAKSYTSNASPYTMYGLLFDDTNHLREEIASGSAQYGANGTSTVPTDGSWTYAAVTYDHTAIRVYFNGSSEGTPTSLATNIDTDDMPLSIGRSGFDLDYFTGRIDEVRVSNIARSACRIQTEYNNMNSPSTFYSVGSEQETGLTFNSKYVVTSSTAVTTTSGTLVDDTQASQTFSLSASKTVLAIYQANSVHNAAMPNTGMQNAISVDGTDRAISWDSPYDTNYAARNTVFWIGTLGSGSHTIKGRFASNTGGSTATVSNRALLIYVLNGDQFQYVDSTTSLSTNSTSLTNDTAASFTFTPSGTCKALILYNISNLWSSEDGCGKKAAIRVGSTDYSQAEKSPRSVNNPDSVFTMWALSLSGSSTTVTGRYASSNGGTVSIHRRQLGVLLFSDTTLLDTISSDTAATTTSNSLVDDPQASGANAISRTTTDSRELLVMAMGTKRYNTSSSQYGQRYGINVDGNDRTHSRSSPLDYTNAESEAAAWGESVSASSHTIKGRFSNNYSSNQAAIDSRRIVALWFPAGTGTGDVTLAEHAAGQETDALSTQHSVTGAELFAFKLTNNLASGVTVDQIQFQLSGVTGFSQSDFANLKIYIDSNNNGTIDVGETTTVGGTGVVISGVTNIAFTTDFSISAGATVNYILIGDVSNLVNNDTVTISLGAGNIALTSGTVGGTAPTNVTEKSEADPYLYRKQISIDKNRIGASCGADLTSFAVLVKIPSDNDLKTVANGGHVQNADGYDIVFRASNGTTVLDHEVEKYVPTTGELWAWVRIPTLDYNDDTIIYLYYGNSAISTSQENKTGVWDSNYKSVWHLKETSGTTIGDSTSNTNTGTASSFTAGPAYYVQSASVDRLTANPGTITFSRPSTSGNLIIVSFNFGNQARTVSSVTDSKGNTYNLAIGPTDWSGTTYRAYTYYASNITGGGSAITITVTLSGAPTSHFEIYASEYTGIATVSPLDQTSSATGTGTAINSGSQTTSQADELIYGYAEENSGYTTSPTAPLVQRENMNLNFTADRTVTSTGSYSVAGTISSSAGWFCHMLTFKAARTTGKIDGGVGLDGSNDYIYTTNQFTDPQEFTIQAWFRSTSASGRKIIGFESNQQGTGSANWDRHLYVGTDGKVYFGCYDVDPVDVAVSTNALNDGSWHHVVGVRDDTANNLYLYVDGNLAATTPNSYAEAGNGYWRMGSYKLQDWTNAADGYSPGSIDEVRVSSSVRTLCWIQTEYNSQNWPNKVESGVTGFITVGGEQDTGTAVSLANHAAGQETDAFGSGSSVTGAELFAFKLTNNFTSGVTVDQIQLQLSGVAGIVQGDFANLAIYIDTNGDGTISGESTTVGGTGSVSAGVTTITFSTDFSISASATVNYILKGDVSNLVAGDTVTIALGTSNVTLPSGMIGGSSATNVTHMADLSDGLRQIHYRWRNDNGNETGAAWLANEDTNITRERGLNTRLRVLVDATGDQPSAQYQLEYKKSTDSTYSRVLPAQPGTALPTYVAAGTVASGTADITPALPSGIQADDILLLFVESANQAISIGNQNGGTWTEAPDSPQGVGASPPTDPSTRLAVFWSRYNGSQGAPTVTDPGNHAVGCIIAIRGCTPTGNPFDVTAGGTEGTADTSGTIPGDTTTGANTLVVTAITSHFDSSGTTEFASWSNADLANLTERIDAIVTSNNGGGIGVATGEKASAGSYGTTSVTLYHSSYKAMWTGALKPGTLQAILVSASSNIAASGENTTAQLTTPAGKSTSNFTTGRIQDDVNPADAVDIVNNYYTELEWCLTATEIAQHGEVYQFRVTSNGIPLTDYSVIAQWTVSVVPNLTQIHYRWRNDDGAESGLDTGTGADGSVTISTSRNINSNVLGSNRSTNADGIVTTVTANPTGTSITVASTTGFAAGDEILLINMQGTSGDTADVGNYEFLRLASVPNGTTLNLATSVQKSYDGTTFSNQKVVVQRVPQWTNVTISSGGTLTANDWAGSSGGLIVFRATGTVDVQSGGTISGNALGYRGGTGGTSSNGGINGESYEGTVGSGGASGSIGTSGGGCGDNYGTNSSGATRGGGGGGGGDITDGNDGAGGAGGGGYGGGGGGGGSGADCSSGGGAGGAGGSTGQSAGGGGRTAQACAAGGAGGTNGSAGGNSGGAGGSGSTTGGGGGGDGYGHTGGAAGGGGGGGTYGTAALTTLFCGSGGGGGGGDSGAGTDRNGGDGGGIIYIIANTVTVSGSITSNGAGGSSANSFHGASGGGAGGSIMIQANTATLGTNLITATGGATAASAGAAGGGGGGGVGRIRVEAGSMTGSTSPAASSPASWWNSSWSKRKAITIDNTGNSNTLTNYQVQVTVTYDSDMQADFDDIRFTNASGTELDYWLYSKTDGVSATFWVEVDSIAASSNTTIYMYYGNASVTTTSNAKNTMFIYENMDSAPTGTLKGSASYDATNDYVILTTTAAGPGQLEYSSSPTPGFVAEWRFWTGGGTGADASWLYEQAATTPAYEDGTGVNGYVFAADEYSDQLQVNYNNTVLSTWGTTTIDNSTWHNVRAVFYQSGGTYYYQFWYDGTQRISSSSTNVPSGSLFGWGARIGGLNNIHRIDDLVVRKYTSPEPTVSTGGELDKPTAGATWMANEDTKLNEAIPGKIYRLRFEVSNEGTSGSGAVTYKLQVAQTDTCGSGSYTDVPVTPTSSDHWKIIDSAYLTDGGATTDVVSGLTNEATTFVPGQVKDTGNVTSGVTLETNQFTELEFAIQTTDYVVLDANYCFRLYNASSTTTLDTYTVYGEIGTSACQYLYRKPLTIDYTKRGSSCGSSGLTEFPVLISMSGVTDIKTTANGGHVQSSSGYDIIFRASNGIDELYHEIEKYDGSTGTLIAWVRVPAVSGTANTTIYMYYGNQCIISAPPSNFPQGVWDSNYQAVWHLKETASGTDSIKDSTANARHGTDVGSPTLGATGEIDGAIDFGNPNTTRRVDTKDFMSSGVTQFTAEAWVYKTATKDARIIYKNNAGNTGHPVFGLASGGDDLLRCRLRISDSSGTDYSAPAPGGTIPLSTWTHVACVYDGSNVRAYKNGQQAGFIGETGTLAATNDVVVLAQNETGTSVDRHWPGRIDEARVSNTARSACWIQTEYNNQNWPNKIESGTSGFVGVGAEEGAAAPTAVSLLSFKATGDGGDVVVAWTTAQEINNFGFHVYRSESVGGPYTRITDRLIPGLTFSVRGRDYSYVDRNVTRGRLYYYKLEDIDFDGQRTMHGPVCVDWDGDGIPDDWEQRYGLDPTVDDSGLDPDGDGLTNSQEYYRNTDPMRLDTDGDGVRDSQEYYGTVTPGLMRGVEVVAFDATGMTLELRTDSFESVVLDEGGVSYRRLRVPEYLHGYTEVVGRPELPVKGILIDLPAGKGGTLSIESVESRELSNYWIYPVPDKVVSGEGELATVSEVFVIDDAAYRLNSFYPDVVARAGETYDYRGQKKLQLFFNPFSFNPVTRELIQYTRIRVRVGYVALAEEEPVVRSGVPLSSPAPSLARAVAWVPPDPASAYKMVVLEDGIYRLTGAYLSSQGVSVGDWSQVRVYNLGQEIPVYQGAEYIEFYGTLPTEDYSKYTRNNVYWLTTSGGSGSPLRMTTIDGTPGGGTVPTTHVFTVHTEEDKESLGEAPGAESLDRWVHGTFALGTGAGGGPTDYPVSLPGVGGTQLGQVTVLLCGLTTLDHDVEIAFNGVSLGTYQWSGFEFYEVSIADVALVDGVNTLTLTCLSGTDPVDPDGVALDWVEVAYPRKYEASGNSLKLTHNAGYKYQIGSFTSNTIQAYDITTATDVKRINNVQVTGANPYTLTMEPVDSGERTYLSLSTSATRTPVSITQDTAGNLSGTGNGADYILITHRDLGWDGGGTAQPWLNNLKAQREAQGLRVKVVDVEDIYDEFSYGIASPQGIKDFLSYTYQNWVSPAPQYVLLVGDSTYDPKDNYGLGTINFVPTYLAQTPFMGESLTDEWYVRISGNDAIADMDIGRLPASTTAQAEMMVNKIITYENTPILKTWERNTLLVADNQVEGYEVLFELMNEDAAGILPTGMNAPFREYLNDYVNPNDLTTSMRSRLNGEGALIWNYSGHGSVQVWASESIFSNGDVATLTNAGKLPFAVAMTCLNGFFGYPEGWNWPSLAEVLLRDSTNGAVAAFMSTGMTEPEAQRVLDQALFEGIFKRDLRTLGRAISYAKQELVANSATLGETGKTFLLFGDPAMRLKVPLPTAPTAPTGQVSGQSVTLTWGASMDANGAAVAGYNVYRSTTPNGPYTKLNSSLITNNQYTDSTVQSGTYYYVVKSVDRDGYESAGTLEMTVTVGARSVGGSGSGGGGGGCFVSTIAN